MLILASSSQARHKLLERAGIDHEIIISNFDENTIKEKDPINLVKSLAEAKAKKVESRLLVKNSDSHINKNASAILGCDSVFEFEGTILGKPKNKEEAIKRLLMMSSKSGTLHTGHYLILIPDDNKRINTHNIKKTHHAVISTLIQFSKLNKKEVELYANTGEPLSCAGCFTLEGKGSKFIQSINGCYSNVIGLSLPWLNTKLFNTGIDQSDKDPD
tara:strand:- start:360 stop:1007 length:648 start_codon:yes stop_codon:yes gene_type:complete